MSNARSLAPWFVFSVASAVGDWRLAANAALVVAVVNALARRRRGSAPDDLAASGMAFFAALAIASSVSPDSHLQHFVPALAPAALGLGAAMSILRGRPFTIPFAKRSTPPELWDQPRFYAANVTITLIWTVSFFVTALALALALSPAAHGSGLVVELEVLGFVVPMRCTAFYRRRLQARYAAATIAAVAA